MAGIGAVPEERAEGSPVGGLAVVLAPELRGEHGEVVGDRGLDFVLAPVVGHGEEYFGRCPDRCFLLYSLFANSEYIGTATRKSLW